MGVVLPLFPCYLFVRILPDPATRLSVLKTPGVLNFVGKWDQLPAVPDHEMEQVRAVVQQRDRFFPCPFLKTGQRIRIRGGGTPPRRGPPPRVPSIAGRECTTTCKPASAAMW